jgi:hypothetical protein
MKLNRKYKKCNKDNRDNIPMLNILVAICLIIIAVQQLIR